MSDTDNAEIKFSLSSLKKKGVLIVLLFILLFGFYLRIYHVDYPVVGYHNWKETHYLTEARNFAEEGFFEHGFFVPFMDYPGIHSDPSGVHPDSFPTISVLIGLFFSLFGISLFLARFIGILFSLGTILMMYLFVRELFKNKTIALIVAFLTALTPLFVFFSHNVQLMNPGVFFMVSSLYFFVKWIRKDTNKFLYLTALFVSLATLTKYGFFIVIVPMLFSIPRKRYKNIKVYLKPLLLCILILSPIALWIIYSEFVIAPGASTGTSIKGSFFNPGLVFSSAWINTLKSYIKDNYTFAGFFMFLLGVITVFILNRKSFASRFLKGSLLGIILFVLIMAPKLQGHSYHQFPIAPFVILFIGYFIMIFSTTIPKMFLKNKNNGFKWVKFLLILVLLVLLYNPSMEAKNRQFDTQFVGLDVAGEYIRNNSEVYERIAHSGHQDYGVLWHADRKGLSGGIPNVEDLQYAEENLNVTWVFVYQWGLASLQGGEITDYLTQNYHPVQVASQNNQLVYVLLKKGGNFNLDGLNELIQGKEVLSREYEYSFGTVQMQYVNLE